MSEVVLFEERATTDGHRIGIATLNAERSLNALTLSMIRLLHDTLLRWENDPAVAAVVLRGAGEKAFCAGGDVRALREALLADPENRHPNPDAVAFFSEEYRLDYRLHTFGKPVVALGGGIVMGGGLGLLVGCSHRVVTPDTRIAMPEITIGLYPDVAGSWFLQRMPARLGLFLGLTGAPLNAHDALIANLADHVVPRPAFDAVIGALCKAGWSDEASANHASVSHLLNTFECAAHDALPPSPVARNLIAIHQLMNRGSLKAVARALASTAFEDPWMAAAARNFAEGCPTSAAVTWEIWRRARNLSLAEALRMELALSVNFCAAGEFSEGVRALLVDKDRSPQWQRATLDDVDAEWIERHFRSPWTADDHPLAHLV
ncbi:enoyl-CoA hydratase/isomerase family protein [Paludibacterium paludis]|uniref:3-hydroxyisobutyryl-CoA hydrolase n=1 Tax=Paludibacterium paludis TaxID=1225769 RepID=A0A918P5Y2_9NEIS|nr:enoyl-CoA hydratase/isomerase family protein [Paludibacterium paludis]GGY21102.1 enoyl-CoA hydratase [Paludibacterium paludis]